MRKTLLFLFPIFCFGAFVHAGTPVIITFEDAEIGSKGGVVSVWDAGTIEVVANTYTTGNSSEKVLRVQKASYMGLYFENLPLPAGAETEYAKIKAKYLVVGGTDINYPALEIYSAPNNNTMEETEKIGSLPWANLWAKAELGVWKTIEFPLSNSLITPVPAGNLILKLVKDDCEYLIDDIELVPAPSASSVFTIADFETNNIDDALPMKKWYPEDGTATVKANPTKPAEKSAQIVTSNYDAMLRTNVTLPTGKTLADYEKISFDVYLLSGYENNYKKMEIYVDGNTVYQDEGYPAQGADDTWITKEYMLDNVESGNSFVLDLGISSPNGNYYIDNIKLYAKTDTVTIVENAKTSSVFFNNNTLYLNNSGNVQIFDTNGRLILAKQNVTTLDLSSVSRGIYIAKALVDGGVEVIKFVK
jgi:hypothetical protein